MNTITQLPMASRNEVEVVVGPSIQQEPPSDWKGRRKAVVPARRSTNKDIFDAFSVARTDVIRETFISAGIACVTMVIAASLGLVSLPSASMYAFGYIVASSISIRSLHRFESVVDLPKLTRLVKH